MIEREGHALSTAARHDFKAAGPACPGWDVNDLLAHIGRIHHRTAGIVRTSRQEPPSKDAGSQPVAPETKAPYQARWRIFNGDLLHHAPTVVVDMSGSTAGGWSDYPADNYSFGRVLHACYTPFATIDHNVLWRLDSPACLVDQLP